MSNTTRPEWNRPGAMPTPTQQWDIAADRAEFGHKHGEQTGITAPCTEEEYSSNPVVGIRVLIALVCILVLATASFLLATFQPWLKVGIR